MPELRDGLYGFDYREADQRRVDPEERKTYDIKALWRVHHRIIELDAQGYKGTEIARILGIHPQTVSNTLNSRLGKEKISEIQRERDEELRAVRATIDELTQKALQVYHEAFNDENGQLSLKDKVKVADTVMLELSGHRVPTKVQSSHVTTMLSPDQIEEFKRRGIEAAKQSGLVIDVTPDKAVNE